LNNLEIYHLKINYERSTNTLIYDRKLEKGSGPSIYGLKVCEAMGLSKEFISYAKSIQKNLELKEFHNSKLSQYNSNVFMDECKICKGQGNLETHHIKDQKYSDNNKMINHHHQNIQHNLVPLCKVCHLKVTLGEITEVGWKETSKGKKLVWKITDKKTSSKKKFDEKEVQKIKEIYIENTEMAKKDILKHYELSYQIKLSQTTLKKIINNTY